MVSVAPVEASTAAPVRWSISRPTFGPASNPVRESVTGAVGTTPTGPVVNDPPILGPVVDQTVVAGFSQSIPLTSTDLEGNPVEYSATIVGDPATATVTPARCFFVKRSATVP